ncbi:MAG TPA: hypothetical protein DEW22_03530 [Clostridiales bacterium]|nr:hypothetical protein [Clostridiales bacterium]
MSMKINVMKSGDKVLNVTSEFVAIERVSGEVDILPLIRQESGVWLDTKNILTIGYGENTIETVIDNGITITNF